MVFVRSRQDEIVLRQLHLGTAVAAEEEETAFGVWSLMVDGGTVVLDVGGSDVGSLHCWAVNRGINHAEPHTGNSLRGWKGETGILMSLIGEQFTQNTECCLVNSVLYSSMHLSMSALAALTVF